MFKHLSVAVVVAALASAAAAQEYVWVEAESGMPKNIVTNAGLNAVDPDELSGGAWVSSFSEKQHPVAGSVECSFSVAREGKYRFWVRATFGTGISYQLDGTPAVAVNGTKAKDEIAIAANGDPYWPRIAWYDLGQVELKAGKHAVTWDLGGNKEPKRWAAVDCFVLTTGEFTPNLKYKPDDKVPAYVTYAPGTMWDFKPEADKLDPSAVLDLRFLNEKVAGEHGFIRLSKDGNSFVRGDGRPIRFWGGSEYAMRNLDLESLRRHAQFLAKRGVNMVRTHMQMEPKKDGDKIDEEQLDQVFKLVAAMKTAGIYVTISPYWGTHCKTLKSWNVTPRDAQPNAARHNDAGEALVFFEPAMQAMYKTMVKELYTRPNPYTKVKLADDPAVAIIQFQNEDSMLWYGLSSVQGECGKLLQRQFADFLKKKYGSLDKALAAWKGFKADFVPDDLAHGLPGLGHVWDFTRAARTKKGKFTGFEERCSDQLQFITETMYKFNADMAKYHREELGCKQLFNAGNWRPADVGLAQDCEYYSYTSTDVVARNNYTGGFHRGVTDGWQVLSGNMYTDVSMTKNPLALPSNVKQPLGHPYIVPETLWVPPDLYRSEAALMMAAQQALGGMDITYWFANGDAEWNESAIAKWYFNSPMALGQFPAAALIFRQGLVKEGQPVVIEHRSLQNLWNRTTPLIAEDAGFDPNHDGPRIADTSSVKNLVDQLAFLVGPVQVAYGSDPAKTCVADMSKYIDAKNKIVRSVTGEIETHYGVGLYKVNAPKAQALAGFLKAAGPQQLADVKIDCRNEYATICVVPLDGKDIKNSAKVLLQVGTIERPTGWTVRPSHVRSDGSLVDSWRIVNVGKMPWQIQKTEATVVVGNARLTKATALDVNGMPTAAQVKLAKADGKLTVTMPADAMYVVLE